MNELSFIVLVCGAVACGGQTLGGSDAAAGSDSGDSGGSGDSGASACSATQSCAAGMICGYAESDGCSATSGVCLGGGPLCNTFQPGCACDGTIINIACTGLPSGYSTKPLSHPGACDGGK